MIEAIQKCLKGRYEALIKALEKSSNSEPFRVPVDYEGLGLWGYPKIIKHPMDLRTIGDKVQSNGYLQPWEFIEDMELMFFNCFKFNGPNNLVFLIGKDLEEEWRKEIVTLMTDTGYCCSHILQYRKKYPKESPRTIKKAELVLCIVCGRALHFACVLYVPDLWNERYTCVRCSPSIQLKERLLPASRLRRTDLSDYIEDNVRTKLGVSNISIRLVHNHSEELTLGTEIHTLLSPNVPASIPYKFKVLLAFQENDDKQYLFFALYAQEYGANSPHPYKNKVYLSYIDSVPFFQPKNKRRKVHQEIVLSFIDYERRRGCHEVCIWVAPPRMHQDYIFNSRPEDQKTLTDADLQAWYEDIFTAGRNEQVIQNVKNKLTEIPPLKDLPFFKGDLFANELTLILKKKKHMKKENVATELSKRFKNVLDAWFSLQLVIPDEILNDEDPELVSSLMKDSASFHQHCDGKKFEFNNEGNAVYSTNRLVYELCNEALENDVKVLSLNKTEPSFE